MDRQLVATTWLYSGLQDIFFAFDKDDESFTYNNLFSEIMGAEKIIKAVILFHLHAEYEGMIPDGKKHKINRLAQGQGHNFKKMLKRLSEIGLFGRLNLAL